MSTIFERLPPELRFAIFDLLAFSDLKSLSLTSSTWRAMCAKLLFTTIRASNRHDNSNDLKEFLHKYARCIEILDFSCWLAPCVEYRYWDRDSEDSKRVSDETLSKPSEYIHHGDKLKRGSTSVSKDMMLLLSGEELPNLSEIKLTFLVEERIGTIKQCICGCWQCLRYHRLKDRFRCVLDDREEPDKVSRSEYYHQWRADLNIVFKAIANNQRVKRLDISSLIPRICTTFETPAWSGFISRLKSLRIDLFGNLVAGWSADIAWGYHHFVSSLNYYFFRHALEVTDMCLIADKDNPIGGKSRINAPSYLPSPLFHNDFPLINNLELVNCFVDTRLLDFLTNKSGQIRTLKLSNCFSACSTELDEDPITWRLFFDTLCDLQPSSLESLLITNDLIASVEEGKHWRIWFPNEIQQNYDALLMRAGIDLDRDEIYEGFTIDIEDMKAHSRLLKLLENNRGRLARIKYY